MGHTVNPTTGKVTIDNSPSTTADMNRLSDRIEEVAETAVASVAALENIEHPKDGMVRLAAGVPYIRVAGQWRKLSSVDDTDWITIAPSANWTITAPVQYRQKNGIVFLRGIITRTSGTDNMFTLPVGFRPTANAVHAVASTAIEPQVRVTVTTAGVVQQTPLAPTALMFLDSISFIAEQ